MRIRVLGSAAGGGFPQWNCNCRNCRGVRDGTIRAQKRTQSSLAVFGSDSNSAALINASPDILQQLAATPTFQPARAPRDTAIKAVLLMDAQIDHTTGLFMLRESASPLEIFCTDSVFGDLSAGNPIFNVLEHYCGVHQRRVALHEPFGVSALADVQFRALPLKSKPPPFSPHRAAPRADDNIGLAITDKHSGGRAFYAPGLAAIDESVWQEMSAGDVVLVDGTFWTDDEMIRLGLSRKLARDMGHLPLSGNDGMIATLARLPAATRKILVHINNTNPILDEDSAERAELSRYGIEIAHDGMEIAL